jgi:hypothetical protein
MKADGLMIGCDHGVHEGLRRHQSTVSEASFVNDLSFQVGVPLSPDIGRSLPAHGFHSHSESP